MQIRIAMASFICPPAQGARPTAPESKKTDDKKGAQIRMEHSFQHTLQDRCRTVIAANLERYPPNALGILSEDAWNAVVRERNEKTKPSSGTGGLDGTGRLLPAVSDRFLAEVEEKNPRFADSSVVDRLAWKDCVEYRFRSGGMTRPAALQYPWPVLVNKLKRSGETLIELLNEDKPSNRNQELLERQVQALSESPMNVSLLQASGVGKAVKKFIKACAKEKPCSVDVHTERPIRGSQPGKVKFALSPLAQLEETLQKWKHIAANSGVQMTSNDRQDDDEDSSFDDQEDLRRAESCQSWRELFLVLKQREEKRRANQGARMREIRKNLATDRPKVIKVRPAKSRHNDILERAEKKKGATEKGYSLSAFSTAPAAASGNAKMKALKRESRIATTLQKSAARPSPTKKKHSFGSAVAFATNPHSKSPSKRKGHDVPLAGGKRMKIPAKATKAPPFHARR